LLAAFWIAALAMTTWITGAEATIPIVMAGLVPAIHVFLVTMSLSVDGRNKSGHDVVTYAARGENR